eukprot:s188_g37.t1
MCKRDRATPEVVARRWIYLETQNQNQLTQTSTCQHVKWVRAVPSAKRLTVLRVSCFACFALINEALENAGAAHESHLNPLRKVP